MTQTIRGERDFLEASPTPVGSSITELATLLGQQNEYLADIAMSLRQQTADVLTFAQVERASQLDNVIKDLGSHQINFLVAGKPVPIYRLLAFSSYDQSVILNFSQPQSSVKDGIVFTAATPALWLPITLDNVYVQAAALSAGLLPVNGPVDPIHGGFFIYGFTIPDYYPIRYTSR